MICISIAQESRRFALVDMHNAARQCDLLEVRLDRFGKAPDVGELLANKPRPVIMSCRRPRDGGQWDGTEDERLAVLRQCIIAKADYAEIELDAADQVRPFPPCKRVISYTNLNETPSDIGRVYAEAQTKHPDVIKLVCRARTPEEAWPLVQILARPAVPTVVVGLGPAAVLLTLLGKKIGAPWAYAALEKGMEAYPGQPTVNDLRQLFHHDAIDRATRFVGVTGGDGRAAVTAAVLNAALAHAGLSYRCLPLAVGSVRLFRKVLDAIKLAAVDVGAEDRTSLAKIATDPDAASRASGAVDLLLHKGERWYGFDTDLPAALAALEAVLAARAPSPAPLKSRVVVIVGASPKAGQLAAAVAQREGVPIIASRDRDAAHELARTAGCRFVLLEALYSTAHDVLVVADDERHLVKPGTRGGEGVHAGYLKPSITVMDLTSPLAPSPLLREAGERGCGVVWPRDLVLGRLRRHARMLTGKELPPGLLEGVFDPLVEQAEEAP